MSTEQLLNRLSPRQRQIINQIASLFLITPEVEASQDVSLNDLMQLYSAVQFVENPENPDLHELQRLLRDGFSIAQNHITSDINYRAWWLTFTLMQADLEMGFYFATGEQSYRRNAINMFGELARILAKERQTWEVKRALTHVNVYKNRLEKRYVQVEPDTNGCMNLAADYIGALDIFSEI